MDGRVSSRTGRSVSVYFIQRATGTGPIKIGCSASPEARRKQLGVNLKVELKILASAPGSYAEERSLHRQFSAHRITGEWFEPTDELVRLIKGVRATGALPPPPEGDRHQTMAGLYQEGSTLQSIGDRFGMTRERVRQILRQMGVPSLGARAATRRQPAPISADEREMARLYSEGVAPKVLKLQFPHLHLSIVRKRVGIASKGTAFWLRSPEVSALAEKVAALYERGVKTADIAAQLGLPAQCYIYRYLRHEGVSASRVRRTRLSPISVSRMVADYHSGMPVSAIAAKYRVAAPTARRAIVRAGVEITKVETERRRIKAVREANYRRFHGCSHNVASAA